MGYMANPDRAGVNYDAASRYSLRMVWGGTLFLAVLAFSRLRYAPKYLFYFDNANFAFALRYFNPALHQPQPPGYPAFVGLLKVVYLATGDANRALLVAGLLGSILAMWLLWIWSSRMFGPVPALLSTALLMFHPVFWLAGVANPVRTFLAVIVAGVGVAAWETMVSATPTKSFYIYSVVFGLLAGFRPEALLLLMPVWITVVVYRRLPWTVRLIGLGWLACAVAVWLVPMVARIGGIYATWTTFSEYVRQRSLGYSFVYGASFSQTAATARRTLIWTFGSSVVWVWALVPFWPKFRSSWERGTVLLITVTLVPAVVFHALFHVRDIDQTLVSIPLVCMVGGVALSSVRPRAAMLACSVIALTGSCWSFRRPFFHDMAAASGSAIRYVDVSTRATFKALDDATVEDGTVLIWHDAVVPWRNVSYYYPHLPMLVVSGEKPFWVNLNPSGPASMEADGCVVVPLPVKQIVLGLSAKQAQIVKKDYPEARSINPLVYLRMATADRLRIGPVCLHVAH